MTASAWRRRRRRRIVAAVVFSALVAGCVGLLFLSRAKSIGYRRGYQMVELRDGMVGYYANRVYKNFTWLDRGREEGLLISAAAKVPPGPYRLYARNQYWVAVYVKLWHAAGVLAVPTVWLWWRVGRRPQRGRCVACGYDLAGLKATAGQAVSCPECGVVDDEPRGESF
ncbi:MAG: hypothetical protein AMXMBFR58_27030 [Phycisphaerae bacterium]